jgi:hypothetical protein
VEDEEPKGEFVDILNWLEVVLTRGVEWKCLKTLRTTRNCLRVLILGNLLYLLPEIRMTDLDNCELVCSAGADHRMVGNIPLLKPQTMRHWLWHNTKRLNA